MFKFSAVFFFSISLLLIFRFNIYNTENLPVNYKSHACTPQISASWQSYLKFLYHLWKNLVIFGNNLHISGGTDSYQNFRNTILMLCAIAPFVFQDTLLFMYV